jgi:hypothetical protein
MEKRVEKEKTQKGVSDKIIIGLLVFTIFVSIFSVWALINNVNNYATKFNNQQIKTGGKVFVNITQGAKISGSAGPGDVSVEILPRP